MGVTNEARGEDRPAPRIEVRDRPETDRYEAAVDCVVVGVAHYRRGPGMITFTHTVVDPAAQGAGVGSRLARFALDEARAAGLRVRPRCPFFRAYIERHPDDRDLLE